jgi:hypothetical protein
LYGLKHGERGQIKSKTLTISFLANIFNCLYIDKENINFTNIDEIPSLIEKNNENIPIISKIVINDKKNKKLVFNYKDK